MLAQPLALKEIVASRQEEKKGNAPDFQSLRLKAGQTLPGGVKSTLHLARGALGRETPASRQWGARQRLGLDKTSVWDQL